LRQQGWSYPKIAKVLGVDHKTIMCWAENQGWEISQPETITGTDGKQYPLPSQVIKIYYLAFVSHSWP